VVPRGHPKNPENRTLHEEIAAVLRWADRFGYNDIPAVAALRSAPTTEHVHAVIQWAEQEEFFNIAGALREHAVLH
jgi:hypothetical protein